SYGQPLLSSDTDYEEMVALLAAATKSSDVTGNEIVFMGHGTEHAANATYQKLDDCFKKAGYANYAIGTVEATPPLEDVIAETGKSGAKKVVLFPLMIVAGDHANKDMAGDDEGSWKTKFKAEGYEVECVLKGLGEYPAIQEMFVRHAGDAIAHLAK
ncbi:MAG: sirohydrochlorin cobaltochelatase, partial [Oscillospiraceae bacterium]